MCNSQEEFQIWWLMNFIGMTQLRDTSELGYYQKEGRIQTG